MKNIHSILTQFFLHFLNNQLKHSLDIMFFSQVKAYNPSFPFSFSNESNKNEPLQKSYTIKIVVCGQPLVGKTSLLKRLTKKTFNPNEPSTVGSEYIHFDYNMPENNQEIHLQIWDTAGEEKYRSLAPLYFRNSNGALLVFDQTSRNTFESLNDWVNIYKESNGDDALFFVIANKSDLINENMKSTKIKFESIENENLNTNRKSLWNEDSFTDEAFKWAESRGYPFFETSAKTGEGVENLLLAIICSFIEKMNVTKKKHFTFKKINVASKETNYQEKCSC